MNHRPLLRLCLKTVAVYLLASAASYIAWFIGPVAIAAVFYPTAFHFAVTGFVLELLSLGLRLALGLYLFFGGEWLVNIAIPRSRSHCPACGYILTAAQPGPCPECGTPIGHSPLSRA